MNIFNEMGKLNLPQGHYVIVGSGPMVVRDMRSSKDLDLVVSSELFEKYKQEGWQQLFKTYPGKTNEMYLKNDEIELYLNVNDKNFNPTLEELVERSDTIKGFSFISLQDVINFKKAYNRPKDREDIKIIEEYLKNKK